jgi:hypothetical protein
MKRAKHKVVAGEMKNAYKNLIAKPERTWFTGGALFIYISKLESEDSLMLQADKL